jgi:hypothetical protein
MYGLDCNYYTKRFPTLEALIEDVLASGMDPCYEVTKDGVGIQEELISFIQF